MDLGTYQKVKHTVNLILDIDLDHYKDEQMRRRLDSWLSRNGALNWDEYFVRIKKDESELRRFRDFLTINVTEFFRDSERWQFLKQKVIPEVLKPGKILRIWSAGCSKGAEIYSTAMLFDELTPSRRHYLLGTDLDLGVLEIAKTGGPFAMEEVRNVSPVQKSMYFKAGGPPYFVNDELKKKVEFRTQDLLKNPFEKNFDIIICRNVVIYFTADTKEFLYHKFYQALGPGGVLFVGGTEIIPKPQSIGFKPSGFSFYFKDKTSISTEQE
jgi:chemotaxis protein methyltransferase CheR